MCYEPCVNIDLLCAYGYLHLLANFSMRSLSVELVGSMSPDGRVKSLSGFPSKLPSRPAVLPARLLGTSTENSKFFFPIQKVREIPGIQLTLHYFLSPRVLKVETKKITNKFKVIFQKNYNHTRYFCLVHTINCLKYN